ncbi:MAG: 2Fe-2S iron-sulfur cluster-binding protein, partial [Paracoccaceae bacterium]
MSTRLATGGRLIERTASLKFTFDGKRLNGLRGDTLASALLANGQTLVGRSYKYHRPRGIIASGAEETNALVGLGEGARLEPNQRTTTTELFDGLRATSQNRWPSLDFDVGAINQAFSHFFSAGFYYKTFMFPRAAWKHVFEPVVRFAAGLGSAPTDRDADRYEYYYHATDVLVVGGGIAGLAAALAAGRAGAKVLVIEQTAHWGGRAPVDGAEIGGKDAQAWIKDALDELGSLANVTLRTRMMGAGVYDHGFALGYERLCDHKPDSEIPRHRLWRIRARRIVTATGAIERPLAFAGNDIPGVMLAGAARDHVVNYAVSPGDRTVVVTNNDDAYRTAIVLVRAGLEVPAILDARSEVTGDLPELARTLGLRIETGAAIAGVRGGKQVEGVTICSHAGEGAALDEIPCDAVAMSGGWSPVVHLWSHCGGKLLWDARWAMFRPDPERPPLGADGKGFVITAGTSSGHLNAAAVLKDAHAAGRRAANETGHRSAAGTVPKADLTSESPILPVWQMPQGAGHKLQSRMFLDFQNDVKVSDVRLAAQEGYESVEHTKRYTTLGMASDQGKLSNINGMAILADALDEDIPAIGTTTFRPPYQPISLGSIAGEARNDLFKPVRKSPIHDWIDANGGHWEPVGDWRRPYCLRRPGESVGAAVTREILNTRQNVGLLDASTLGKIIVKGPDAGRFLDMLYTNMMSSLKVGRCRYGLMCTENGFLFDDGVVARLAQDEFLCHTTSGGSDRVFGWLEEWLQCEWWDLKVYTANVTEQFAQIAVVGPKARAVLEKLGGIDVSAETLPFMSFVNGELAGIPARIHRISFSGELSYEIAVPASRGQELWDRLREAGEALRRDRLALAELRDLGEHRIEGQRETLWRAAVVPRGD